MAAFYATLALTLSTIASVRASSSYQNTAFASVYKNFGRIESSPVSTAVSYSGPSTSLWESRNTVLDTIPHISGFEYNSEVDYSELEELASDDTSEFDEDPYRLLLIASDSSAALAMYAPDGSLSDSTVVTSAGSTVSSSSVPASVPAVAPLVAVPSSSIPACPAGVAAGLACAISSEGNSCVDASATLQCWCTHSLSMGSATMFMWSCSTTSVSSPVS